jgi:hypothetical protein
VDEEEKTEWIEVSTFWDYGSVDVVCNFSLSGRTGVHLLGFGFGFWVLGFGVWPTLCLYTPLSRNVRMRLNWNTNGHLYIHTLRLITSSPHTQATNGAQL